MSACFDFNSLSRSFAALLSHLQFSFQFMQSAEDIKCKLNQIIQFSWRFDWFTHITLQCSKWLLQHFAMNYGKFELMQRLFQFLSVFEFNHFNLLEKCGKRQTTKNETRSPDRELIFNFGFAFIRICLLLCRMPYAIYKLVLGV